ncbi:MAG TPA: 3-hydroxyacyl-CoA dehydrogenase family protein [Puia sp.]|jgi:3-hydroxybutyryl-CoA dehydrogenase|nr:3-hydroxyacyl-CoA dehydrogenase family protein [Puia sp.]
MKIALLANNVSKEEFLFKKIPSSVEIIMVGSLSQLVLTKNADAYFDLEFVMDDERIRQLHSLLPKPIFINSITNTLTEIDQPFIRINAWPTFLKRNICEIVADENQKNIAKEILDNLQRSFQFVPDVPGMITARIIAMIINEAYYTFEDDVSTKEEIDIAIKLGTNYPFGPFEWSEKIGLKNIYDLLLQLSKTDSRYTISKSLQKEIE